MASKIQQGSAAEALACRYLQARGLTVVDRNYVCRVGELDLIMQDGAYLVFVEVRSRHDNSHGTPAETVTKTKQRRIIRAANYYLQRHHADIPCRFDVIAITPNQTDPEWIKDAFQVF